MLGLGKILFGEKVKINVEDLGVFKARVRNIHKKNILWTGKVIPNGYNDELILLLLGDARGPCTSEIETVKLIINNLESIKRQIIEMLNKNKELKEKFHNQRMSDFYLACINPWRKNEVSNELSFESNINDGYVGAIFKNGRITEVNL